MGAETIKHEPHSQTLIRVPRDQLVRNQNVIVEPAFTISRQGLTTASVLATLDKAWVPVILLNTPNETLSLPRSLFLVHCAMLEDQPVLCGCSLPTAQTSAVGVAPRGLSDKQLQDLVAAVWKRERHLPSTEIDEVIAVVRENADVFENSDMDLGVWLRSSTRSTQGMQLPLSKGFTASRIVIGPK